MYALEKHVVIFYTESNVCTTDNSFSYLYKTIYAVNSMSCICFKISAHLYENIIFFIFTVIIKSNLLIVKLYLNYIRILIKTSPTALTVFDLIFKHYFQLFLKNKNFSKSYRNHPKSKTSCMTHLEILCTYLQFLIVGIWLHPWRYIN